MIGETAALATACCWAIAARLFRGLGASFSPLAMNLWKGALGILILTPMTMVTLWQGADFTLTQSQWGWLLLSGAIGIGLGDTFFFKALQSIGDNQTLLIAETLAPIATALLAMAWIGEWLTPTQWLGIGLILFSVDRVIRLQRKRQQQDFALSGVAFAALAALCQAIGAVISRDILLASEIDPANASHLRLWGGMGVIIVLMVLTRQRWLPITHNAMRTWRLFFFASLIGTFAALYLQMLAFAHTRAAVVQTLFATSVILSLLLAKVLGERVSGRVLSWSLLAFAGVGVLIISETGLAIGH